MTLYLLDTNHLSEGIRRVSCVRDRVQSESLAGHTFITISPALCELERGIQQTGAPSEYRRRLDTLLWIVQIREMDRQSAEHYGSICEILRQRGRALSIVDRMLAAVAIQWGTILLTTDLDFTALPEIRVENWFGE